MTVPRPYPQTPDEWADEINLAYLDARGTKLFALLTGTRLTDANLFHVAPLVCLKFRGLGLRDKELRQRVVEGALATYVKNTDSEAPAQNLGSEPKLAFALCYVTAHFVLDLLDEQAANDIMHHYEDGLNAGASER